MRFKKIRKRDGRIEEFKAEKITNAIAKAGAATGEFDREVAKKLTIKVLSLAEEVIKSDIPTVEEIQDIVEEVLLTSPYKKTAKAYIIYRDQHAKIREIVERADVSLVDQYLQKLDWQVRENSNMTFSLQGLNNYISSQISRIYWLNKIYPPEVKRAHVEGDFHIHDLNLLAVYCVGWDLYDLLLRGFGGVPGKIESRPARHFRSALGQVVNYFYTLQGECYSADTQVLTEDGWKYFYELSEEHKIFTLNIETQKIELQKPIRFYEFNYKGELYNFKSKKLDLLVTPNHNMIVSQYAPHTKERYQRKFVKAKDFNPNTHFIPKGGIWEGKHQKEFVLPAIQIKQYRHFANSYETVHIKAKRIDMKDWLAFFGFWLAEGSTYLRKRNRRRRGKKAFYGYLVRISQNKGKIAQEFEALLKRLPFNFYKKERGRKVEFVIQNKQLFSYLSQFGKAGEKYIPKEIKSLDREYLRILFHWLVKGDGYEGNGNLDYYTKSKKLADDVQEIVLKLGWNANIYEKRKGSSKWYRVAISKTKHFKFREIKKVKYQGKVYCVEVPNHTLYVRRNGKACWCGNSAGAQAFSNFDTLLSPFIRYDNLSERDVEQALQEFVFNINVPTRVGFQTPFTNITLDVNVPTTFADMPVVIGGEPRSETYADFQDEMDMFNRAFLKVLLEGDAKGRVFSVDGDALCPIKNSGRFELVRIGKFIDNFMEKRSPVFIKERNCEVLDVRDLDLKCIGLKNGKLGWQKINYLIRHPQSEVLKITTDGGFNIRVTPAHSVLVLKDGRIQSYPAGKLKKGDYLVAPKKFPQEKSEVDAISLAHEFIRRKKAKGVYIRGVQKEGKLYKETRRCEGKFRYNYKVEIFPLENISAELDKFDLSKARLSLRGSKVTVPNFLPITKDLVEFLGWYCAEGSAERGKYGGVSLGLNLLKERKRAHYLAEIIRRVFGVPVSLREVKERNLIEIRVHSKLVRRIITEVFEIENGEGKRVPQIIFELPEELKRVFLESYFKGDAWITENIVATSVSRELIYGISTILKQLSVFHTLEEYSWKGKKRYRIRIFNNRDLKAKSSHTISKIPLKESGIEELVCEILRKEPFYMDNLGRRYKNTKKRMLRKFGITNQRSTNLENVKKIANYAQNLNIELPPALQEILEDEISFFRIKRIEKVDSTNGMVYDFSTESETFVADQLIVHNTFPIPTYNITKDFRWDDECIELLWEVTAKYGIPYFSNFINSDMRPEDARSMCFPGYTKVIYKDGKRGQCQRTTIRRLVENWHPEKEFYLLMNGEWVKITKSFKLKNSSGKIIVVTLRNGEIIKMTPDHPAMIVENGKLKQVFAKDLKVGDMIPIAKRGYEGELGDFELGRFLGLYIAEGGISKNTVYFSFNANETELQKFVKEVAEKRFAFPVRITKDPRWNAVQVWVKSKSAVEWIRKFCSGDAASEKRILAPCYGMSREFRLGVLVGIFQGDGYERDLELNIINKRLRDDIADLARSVGINYTKRTNPNNRKGKKVFTSYVLRLCRDSLNELLPYFKNIKASTSSIYEDFGDFYGVKIKSIKIQNYHAPVYDFEVDSKEHLFQLANGVITHNCCRLRLDLKKLERRGGGLFGASPMTGSIGVVTINMPRLGYLSSDESEFFERLERLMVLAKESLEIKRKVLERFTDADLYPYSKYYLKGIKERFGEYWKNHFSTIGLVGMNEACINLLGENIASVEGRKFTLKVLDFMREKLVEFQEETGNLYNLEATPAEGCSYRLALLDKERFPDIICANEEEYRKGAEPFYTNSSQLPVNYTDDVFEALELQEEIQTKYTGGTVFHVYVGEEITDYGVVKRLVRKICENFRIPYFTITPTFSICPAHGYIAGRHEKCPHCGRDCEVYSRVVGYLRPVSQWNAGKQEEFKMRKTFKIV
ncbi:MAG: anaerobic ribonucleoside-triphosphate reductase [Candidatus Methanospirare jalkutatii]|nr:anaerobic ribonucleoside-triphosphate reductase [Candidatus Methanospirare jalkutatii]